MSKLLLPELSKKPHKRLSVNSNTEKSSLLLSFHSPYYKSLTVFIFFW